MIRTPFSVLGCLLLVSLLVSCSSHNNLLSNHLEVESIQFDSENSQSIRQIVIKFDRIIAINGAVPSADQIHAISISNGLESACTWRFVRLDAIACELGQELQFMSRYDIEITPAFQALGNSLLRAAGTTITTPVPPIQFEFPRPYRGFPKSIVLKDYQSTNIPIDAYQQGIKIKSPSGQYFDVSVVEYSPFSGQNDLEISILERNFSLEDGYYEIVFPIGFQASTAHVALTQEVTLDKFWFSRQFTFLGFACQQTDFFDRYVDIQLTDKGQLPCAPERVALKFSIPPMQTDTLYQNSQSRIEFDWLKGPRYTPISMQEQNRVYYLSIELSGESRYAIDLSLITSIDAEKILSPQFITFETLASTSSWYFNQRLGTVTESDDPTFPLVFRRNVEFLQQRITPIESEVDLLAFLNGSGQTLNESWPAAPDTMNALNPQPLKFTKHLPTEKGMVHYVLSGNNNDQFGHSGTQAKQQQIMFQTADFNIAIWHQDDLLLKFYDWNAQPVTNARVYLVCEGQSTPILLGHSDLTGGLWLGPERWRDHYMHYRAHQCWIWSSRDQAHAAIKLPESANRAFNKIKAYAWSAQPIYQPGEIVDIGLIVRTREDSGITIPSSLDQYTLTIQSYSGLDPIAVNLSALSAQGFANAKFALLDDYPPGNYFISLRHKSTNATQHVGEFTVAEFTPPEFEVNVMTSQTTVIGGSFSIDITANRMNGVPLRHASIAVDAYISRLYTTPKLWPKGYDFDSWSDFDANKNGKETLNRLVTALDANGHTVLNSEVLASTVPLGRINVLSEIIADDGEAQTVSNSITYFSRTHYIGTKFDKESGRLSVIAIDPEGNHLSDINADVQVLVEASQPFEQDKLIASCAFAQLPGSCVIERSDQSLKLVISSGLEGYSWSRRVHIASKPPQQINQFAQEFSLQTKENSYRVGQRIQLTLSSPLAGTVDFILQAGTINKVWQQQVDAGQTEIELIASQELLPYARIYAVLPVAKATAEAAREQSIRQIEQTSPGASPDYQHLFESQRLLTSIAHVTINTTVPKPRVTLELEQPDITPGKEVQLTLSTDMNAESQLWLVNESILNLMNVEDQDFDFYSKLYSKYAFEDALTFDALSNRLILGVLPPSNNDDFESVSMTGRRMRAPPPPMEAAGLSVQMDMAPQSQLAAEDFAQSIWLDRLELDANQPQQIRIKLPQLIGRWKIVALTATPLSMSVDSVSLPTRREIEYFLDAPRVLFDVDTAEFAVSAINRSPDSTPQSNQDTLTLWINGQDVAQFESQTNSGEHARNYYALPKLAPGKYSLVLRSQLQPEFAAFHALTVLESAQHRSKTWLVEPTQEKVVHLPSNAIEDSISLSKLSAESITPDWSALVDYNQNYPHACLEQTLSRVLSYYVNPVAVEQWPAGIQQLTSLLATQVRQQAFGDWFSYFPGQLPDPFLTAYVYLASAWLEDKVSSVLPNKQALADALKAELVSTGENHLFTSDASAKSMMLLALASNNDIDLPQALEMRQQLGRSNVQAAVLQALALKSLGADPSLYINDIVDTLETGYLDTYTNVFNQTSQKCLAAMVFDEGDAYREGLLSEAISEQHGVGHFGSTFANAVCSVALQSRQTATGGFEAIDFRQLGDSLNYTTATLSNYWLRMMYSQPLAEVATESSGISIQRRLFVKRGQDWLPINANHSLRIGDLVKTKLLVSSPITREHVVISDSVPGGFEAINPWMGNNKYYESIFSGDWFYSNQLQIRQGQAHWFLRYLSEGDSEFTYFSRVRHTGRFNLAPAKAETMYRGHVYATTSSDTVTVVE